jgi:hypothetical protein
MLGLRRIDRECQPWVKTDISSLHSGNFPIAFAAPGVCILCMARCVRVAVQALVAASVATGGPASPFVAADYGQPLRFFEGRTEMISIVKVIMKSPYRSHTTGRGEIRSDGSLVLVQLVEEAGKPAHQRYWTIRQVDKDQFTGTMSDALGPVRVQKIAVGYKFSFRLKGNLALEQWLMPAPGGRSARSRMIVRKYGIRVASSEGTIRKL